MTPTLRKVKAQGYVIFFDAVGTLIELERPVGWHYAEVARRHGARADETAITEAFRRVFRNLPTRAPSSSPRPDDDVPWWREIALRVLRESTSLPVDFDESRWFEEIYNRFSQPGVWVLYSDVIPCLERVKGHHRLAILSNFDGRLRRILQDLNIASYFDYMFISSEMGCEKPQREIFEQALKVMEVPPSQALHVGDDARLDEEGGKSAGLATFLLQRPKITLEGLGS